MAIQNKRVAVKQDLKSKVKDTFKRFLKEDEFDETSLGDEVPAEETELGTEDLGGDELADVTGEGLEDETSGLDGLSDTQQQTFDAEIDELLSASLTGEETSGIDDIDLTEDEDLLLDDTDEVPGDEIVDSTEDTLGTEGLEGMVTDEDDFITDLLTEPEVEEVIASPDSFHALEDELVNKITSEGSEDNELIEAVIASELKALDFEEDDTDLETTYGSEPSATGIKGGADQKDAPKVTKMDVTKTIEESKKKSKMLVKAATAINKLRKESVKANAEVAKLKLEKENLIKANNILAVAGDRLAKETRIKISEGFKKCVTAKQSKDLYEKVILAIKGTKNTSNKSLNEVAKSSKQITVKKELQESVATASSKAQLRKNFLMGMENTADCYYEF